MGSTPIQQRIASGWNRVLPVQGNQIRKRRQRVLKLNESAPKCRILLRSSWSLLRGRNETAERGMAGLARPGSLELSKGTGWTPQKPGIACKPPSKERSKKRSNRNIKLLACEILHLGFCKRHEQTDA